MRMQSKVTRSVWGGAFAMALVCGCGGGDKPSPKAAAKAATPPPEWVIEVELNSEKLCGLGVAGAGYNDDSPYPKALAKERAARNLAGILGTSVEEAIIDKENGRGQSIETTRVLHVDQSVAEAILEMGEAEFWIDKDGSGPYAQKNFTYAHLCIDTKKAAATFKMDPKALGQAKKKPVSPKRVPAWVKATGKQAGGKLCAVGFSLPMFFADKTFEGVVEDVRGQLAEVIETLVSSYYEELTNNRSFAYEAMTVATTQALAKGVIVSEFWYDEKGIGPNKHARSTYGWGCVYPMDIVNQSLAAVEEKLPEEEQNKIAKVRERAADAFEALDVEIEKRSDATPSAVAAEARSE